MKIWGGRNVEEISNLAQEILSNMKVRKFAKVAKIYTGRRILMEKIWCKLNIKALNFFY